MLARSCTRHHRSGKARAFVFRDPSLRLLRAGSGFQQLKRMGMPSQSTLGYQKVDHFYANSQYQHAWPLLTHDDFGNSDQSNDTKNIMYSMYMPKRNKGTAPWFRGADTYSVKYSEQGRFEYQRYLMINRFPSEYKKHFLRFLTNMKSASPRPGSPVLPQEALHWLLRMIVDNFNPQHVHYIAAMRVLLEAGEVDMGRDVWKIMERQQTCPDTSTLCAYLDLCLAANEPTWAFQAWNRYGNELRFLEPGEVDPKPITRTPFSLTREELLYLPKWKKHFDHDPNLDVPDLNRFNRTREVYLKMAKIMLRSGTETDLFLHFWRTLVEAMRTTPTPVPEPPNPHMIRRPRWQPFEHCPSPHQSPWRVQNNRRVKALGPSESTIDQMNSRYFTNQQFLVHAVRECIEVVLTGWAHRGTPVTESPNTPGASSTSSTTDESASTKSTPLYQRSAEEVLAFCEETLLSVLRPPTNGGGSSEETPPVVQAAALDERALLQTVLRLHRIVKHASGSELLQFAHSFTLSSAASGTLPSSQPPRAALCTAHYLEVLKGLADEGAFELVKPPLPSSAALKSKGTRDPCASPTSYRYLRPAFDPKAVMKQLALVLQEIQSQPYLTWSADLHLEVVKVLVRCGTMKGNEYFVNHVLRQFEWSCSFLEELYLEYRRHEDVELWAELTKRALVWTARYDVVVSEKLKRLIEDDYSFIGVQTRTFRELAVFQFKDVEEKRMEKQMSSALPNPWIDYVSHALPFPDRDAGYPDEFGDIGQWRAPGGPGSPVKGPGFYAPPMEGEHLRGYTAEWRDLKNPMRPPTFPDPWEKKYAQYARGQHPSYDMVYAGPMPQIFPERYNFRKPTRWDYHDIEKQGKFKISGPY